MPDAGNNIPVPKTRAGCIELAKMIRAELAKINQILENALAPLYAIRDEYESDRLFLRGFAGRDVLPPWADLTRDEQRAYIDHRMEKSNRGPAPTPEK